MRIAPLTSIACIALAATVTGVRPERRGHATVEDLRGAPIPAPRTPRARAPIPPPRTAGDTGPSASALAGQAIERGSLRLHFLLRPVGWERYTIVRAGDSLQLASTVDFTERGTRVQLTASLDLGSDLSPRRFAAHGRSYRIFAVDTRVDLHGHLATVRTLLDSSATVRFTGAAFPIDGYAPLAVQMMLVRYWRTHGRPATLRVLPGDATSVARITVRGRDTLRVKGRAVVLERFAIDGVVWGQESLWLDERGRLAAVTTLAGGLPFEGVREEYDEALPHLVARAIADRMDDLRALSARVRPIASGRVALVGATLIDGTGTAPIVDGVIVVDAGTVTAMGARGTVVIPPGTRRLDVRGRTIIPGLWDMHAHVAQIEWGPAYLAAGVTTVRDMGGERDFLRAMRDVIDRDRAPGPRLLLAGLVDGGGPSAFGVDTAVTAEEAVQVVRGYHAQGFRQIKVYSLVKPDVVAALAREAHRLGMTVTGHVPVGMSPEQAVDSGFDQLAHLVVHGDPAAPASREAIAFLARHGTVMDPTVSWNELLGHASAVPVRAFQPGVSMLPYPLRALLLTTGAEVDTAVARARLTQQLAMIAALHAAGLPVVAGTDKGVPGHSLHRELELYVAAGLTPMEALRSATAVPARVMGLAGQVGTLAPGMRADLVVLDANPLDAIANIRRVHWTMTAGRLYDAAALWRSVGADPCGTAVAPGCRRPASGVQGR